MDHLDKEKRSWNMSRIRSRNTNPEKIVRKILTSLGHRYRLYSAKLPGRPDIIISKSNLVIFINGCFWHQHRGCKRKTMPKTNTKYWKSKLKKNVEKQERDIKQLKKEGWKIYIVWECETKNEKALTAKLKKYL